MYIFFSGSIKRWKVLKKHLSQLCLCAGQAEIDALRPLRDQLCEIHDALVIIEDVNRDANTIVKIRLSQYLCSSKNHNNYPSLCSYWKKKFFKIN